MKFNERSIPPVPLVSRMRTILIVMALSMVSILPHRVQAQTDNTDSSLEEVVVTATQKPIPESLTGSAVTVINREEIEEQQAVRVSELLQSVPGVSLSQEGSLGGKTNVRMRGVDSKYTQVLVNGVRINDPTAPEGTYDFSTLTTDNIQRIEVVRGNQSVLHGSDAIGGVINIITKEGTEETQAQATVENGSFGTRRVSTEVSGSVQGLRFSTSLSRYETDGISAVATGTEKDGYENRTVSTRFSAPIAPNWELSSFFRLSEAFTETDDGFFLMDDNSSQDIEESVGSVELKSTGSTSLRQTLRASWFDQDRQRNSAFGNDYAGNRERIEYETSYDLNTEQILAGTVRYENEHAASTSGLDEEFRTVSAAGEYQYAPGNWLHTVGLRGLDHEEFGSYTTGRITTAYYTNVLAGLVGGSETKLRASYGTGFNAPTVYQLYNNQPALAVGNPDLDPETSQGGDLGLEHYLNKTDHLSLTYFRNEIEDQFGFRRSNPPGELDYFNQDGTTETEGFESSLHVQPFDQVSLDLNYTYQQSQDASGNDLDLIPENKASGTVQWNSTDSLQLGLNAEYNDERPDGAATLDEYTLVGSTARYTIDSSSTAFVRLENAFDEDYQEVDGYGTPGRAAYGGITMKF